jgi:hypothetical protein
MTYRKQQPKCLILCHAQSLSDSCVVRGQLPKKQKGSSAITQTADTEQLGQHGFMEHAVAQSVDNQVQRGLGGAMIQHWHCGWLTRLLMSERQSGWSRCWLLSGLWSRVGSACALWSPSGFVVQQATHEAGRPPPFWSALHDMIAQGMIGLFRLAQGFVREFAGML